MSISGKRKTSDDGSGGGIVTSPAIINGGRGTEFGMKGGGG